MLFLDIDMPEKDGFSVAEELTAMPSKPLIIFLSGMEDLVYQSFAFSAVLVSPQNASGGAAAGNRENAADSQQPSDSLHGYDERQQHPHSNHGDYVF